MSQGRAVVQLQPCSSPDSTVPIRKPRTELLSSWSSPHARAARRQDGPLSGHILAGVADARAEPLLERATRPLAGQRRSTTNAARPPVWAASTLLPRSNELPI